MAANQQAPVPDGTTNIPSRAEFDAFLCRGAHVLLTSHQRPDGDAVGSMLAFAGMLDQLGVTSDLVLADPVPQVYRTLPNVERIRRAQQVDATAYASVVVLECDGVERIGITGLGSLPVLNLDHHRTGTAYGSVNWVDCTVCAVAVLVLQLARMLQVQITPDMATCLYTAVFTDTGAFTYPGTTSSAFALASELIALGANADAVAYDVLYSFSAGHVRLLGTALSRLQLRGRVAWSYVTQQDLADADATDEDSEGTVTYLISIATVQAAIFLRELPAVADASQRFRVSLRSKSSLDVSVVAAAFGGGGHRSAAGCLLEGDLNGIVNLLLAALDPQHAPAVQA